MRHDFTVLTCEKRYENIPFAHRQYTHKGHCRFIHGHNWTIVLTFGAKKTDENGFVADFGALKEIKQWIDDNLDHALVVSSDDPLYHIWTEAERLGAAKLFVSNGSTESLAEKLYGTFFQIVHSAFSGRAVLMSIKVEEDSKNSATFKNPQYFGDNTVQLGHS